MPVYTQTNLKDQIADTIALANIANELNMQNIVNRAVRMVNNEVDIRSTKRRAPLAQKVFDERYEYSCPSDLKDNAVIDLDPQTERSLDSRLFLVTPEQFRRKKSVYSNQIAVQDDDVTRTLLIDLDADDTAETLARLDSATEDGTWSVYGNGSSLTADTSNYIAGAGSLKFNLTSGGTTAGIQNTTLTSIDISDYTADGSIFVWAYITETANLTNFVLDIGNDLTTNYYTQTVTTANDGTAFEAGWNLLRFDFVSMTENGTVTDTSVDSIRLYMTKDSAKTGDDYRFDNMVIHTGQYFDVLYYSKYPWQTSGGTFIENSTTSTDKLNCDANELELYVFRGKMEMYRELEDWNQYKAAEATYKEQKAAYQKRNPSERLKYEVTYY